MANSSIINTVREANDPAAALNAGATPQGVANPAPQVAAQPTMAPSTAPTAAPAAAPATTPTPAPVDYTGQINGLYQSELGRSADTAGMNFFNTNAQNGTSLGDIKSALDSSPEYAARHAAQVPPPTAPTAAPVAAPTAATYTPSLLGNPTQWNVTPNQTVAGQITGILDPNSPIIQQARTQGLQMANDRGLLNSSIGETAAMDAAYNAALPIAQADAATNSKAAGYNADQSNQFAVHNQDASNTAGAFNSNQTNQMAQSVLSAQTQTSIANLQAQTQTNLAYLDNQTKTNLANLSNNNQIALAGIEANYHTLMQSNASASDLFRQITQNIATISMSKDMDGTAKQAAVDNQLQLLKNGMQINGAVSNLNLGGLLDFSGANQQPAAPTVPGVTP